MLIFICSLYAVYSMELRCSELAMRAASVMPPLEVGEKIKSA
jgi:hypothetical protein